MTVLAPAVVPAQIPVLRAPGVHVVPINVEQYHEMIRTGILPEGAPIELIDGVLVVKDRSRRGGDVMSIGPEHRVAVAKVGRLEPALEALGFVICTQQPVTLRPNGEPEPDGQIVRGPIERYAKVHPTGVDVCVAIEVADATLAYDRTTKLKTYARAGVPQYVIVNLVDNVIEVREGVDVSAEAYAAPTVVARGGTVTFRLFDGATLDVPAVQLLP